MQEEFSDDISLCQLVEDLQVAGKALEQANIVLRNKVDELKATQEELEAQLKNLKITMRKYAIE